MAVYIVTGPDGHEYQIEGPEGATDEQVRAQVASQVEQERRAKTGSAGDFLRSAAAGLTFNFGDEIEAGARALFDPSKSYEKHLSTIRRDMDLFRDEYPVLSTATELAGGMVVPGGLLKGAMNLKRLATAGGIGGGVSGLGASEGDILSADTAGNVILGSALGGTAGAAMGSVGGLLSGRANRQQAALQRRLLQGQTADDLANQVRDLGQEAMLADANEITRAAAGTAVRSMPENATSFTTRLADRQAGSAHRLEDALRTEAGVPVDRARAEELMAQQRRSQAQADYGGINFNATVYDGPREIVDSRWGQKIARDILEEYRYRTGDQSLQWGDISDLPEVWHRLQSDLRTVASKIPMDSRATAAKGNVLTDARQKIHQRLGEILPGYEQASANYAANSRLLDSLKDSMDFQKIRKSEVEKIVRQMGPEQRQAYTVGVIDDLINKMMKGGETGSRARQLFKSQDIKDKLGILVGQPMAGRILREAEKEARKFDTWHEVFGNSATARRLQAGEVFRDDVNPFGIASDLARGNFLEGVLRAIPFRQGGNTLDEAAAKNILDLMGESNPDQIRRGLMSLGSGYHNFLRGSGVGAGAAINPTTERLRLR